MTESALSDSHQRLLEEIQSEARETANWTGRECFSDRVMAAMAKVPRHEFVPLVERAFAYANRPLSIGHGQTISQPYIVAAMTDLLDIDKTDRVLELGTGCGYHAAVLSEVASEVFSVETVSALAAAARERLARLGYDSVHVLSGDGNAGWPEHAPYDAAIVTAAPIDIPSAVVDQLKTGGRLVIPLGSPGETQMLYRCEKREDGTLQRDKKLPVAFVPLVGR